MDEKLSKTAALLAHLDRPAVGSGAESLRQLETSLARLNGFRLNDSLARAFRGIDLQGQLLKSIAGSLDGFPRVQLFADPYSGMLDQVRATLAAFENRFRLPEAAESLQLIQRLPEFTLGRLAQEFDGSVENLRKSLEVLHTPWVNIADPLASVHGLARLHSIGIALEALAPFESGLTAALRDSLGDWRGDVDFSDMLLEDPLARTDFYIAHGYDPKLTDLPLAAFDESLALFGLQEFPTEVESTEPEREAGFARNNRTHDRLQRFEVALRAFVGHHMTREFGANWIQVRVPDLMRKTWQDRHAKAQAARQKPCELFEFSDFGDYINLIVQKDHWNRIFQGVFLRKDSVEESFRRMTLARNCIAHSRMLTMDDEIFVAVEFRRVLKAINLKS